MIFRLDNQGKLAGDSLSTDRLLEHLPFLKEILDAKELTRSQLDNFARDAASLRHFRAGDVVCEEGDFGSTAFYLVSGRVEVAINNPLARLHTRRAGGGFMGRGIARLKRMTSFLVSDDQATPAPDAKDFIAIDAPVDLPRHRPIAELGAGELFGEMTCRTFQPRSATITCLEDCVMVEMLRVILDMLTGNRAVSDVIKSTTKVKAATFKGSPTFRRLMEDKYRERNLGTHLRGVPVFASLDETFLAELTRSVELVSHSAGDTIVKQGEPADAFYLVRSGMVKVSLDMPGGELVRTYLSRGDYFGEIGLLTPGGTRTATCRALDQTDVVRINRDVFEKILEQHPQVRVQLKLVADARLRSLQSRRLPVGQNMEEFLGQGLFEAQNLLLIDLDKCTRCDACVTACAEAHDGVTRLLRDGLRYDRYLVATACRSCHDPLCMTQCPVGSIRRKESLEIQIESWCIGCSKCAELCPYGNINMHPFEAPEKPARAAAAPAPAARAAKPAANAAPKSAPAAMAKPETGPAQPKTPPPMVDGASLPQPADSSKQPAISTAQPVIANDLKPPSSTQDPRGDKPTAAQPTAPAAATVPTPKPAPLKPTPTSAAAKPAAAAAAPKPPAPAGPRKKSTTLKATTCDLCTDLLTPSCVYACPHDAAMRVDPALYFAGQKSATDRRRRSWLRRLLFKEGPDNRTTH